MKLSKRHIVLAGLLLIFCTNAVLAGEEEESPIKSEEPQKEKMAEPLEQHLAGNYLANHYAINNENPEDAADVFFQAIKENPDSIELLSKGYKVLIEAGEVDKAAKIAQIYREKKGSDLNASLFLALYCMSNGKFDEAEKIIQDVTNNNSEITVSAVNAVIMPFVKLWIKVGQKKYDDALDYSKNILGEGKIPSLFLSYQSGIIKDIMGDSEGTAQKFEEFSVDPRVMMPYHFVRVAGNFYERNNNPEKAKKIYLAYIKQHPDTKHFQYSINHINSWFGRHERLVSNAQLGVAEVLKEVVRVIYTGGYYREGLQYLRLVLYINPDDQEAKMLLARYYDENNEFLKAVKVYRGIDKGSDFHVAAMVNAAENMYKLGNKAKAVKMLKNAARKDTKPTPILLSLADLMRQDKKYKDAASVYTRVIENINQPKLGDWPVFFARGICYERYGDWNKSEADLLMALSLRPQQPEVMNYLGYSWIEKNKNIERAKEMIESAVKVRPDDAQVIDSMGWALFKLKEYDKATEYLEKAASINPYDSVINDHLGDSYWQQGRYNEAVFQWNRSISYVNEDDDISVAKVKEKVQKGL